MSEGRWITPPTKRYGSFTFTRCDNPNCRTIHVVLFDHPSDELPVAEFAIPIDAVPSITEDIKNCAYNISALKDD